MEVFKERSLAHMERIVDIQPIESADKIEVATVLGWKCVVKKGEYKIGDLVCYIEIDSVVPPTAYFDFMKDRKYRVRTIKLKGQISQGLVIPFKDVPTDRTLGEGTDVTEILGITKWESESDKESNTLSVDKKKIPWYASLFLGKRSKGFPKWISKTDEPRIQNMPWVLKNDGLFVATEKLDGQSATYWYKKIGLFGHEFGICSRTMRQNEKCNSNWSIVAREKDIKNKLKSVKKDICIQGEIIGPRIQGNKYNLNELDFFVFNVYDIKTHTYYKADDIIKFCAKYGFKYVPVIYGGRINEHDTVDSIVETAKGKSVLCDTLREGLVYRSFDQSLSFKVINPDFLLKEKE